MTKQYVEKEFSLVTLFSLSPEEEKTFQLFAKKTTFK
jgi:hypothetical protein